MKRRRKSNSVKTSKPLFDPLTIRKDFPILATQVHGKPLVYLDNANTTQKPRCVIEALDRYYRTYNSNVHRASHRLGELAEQAYEGARDKVWDFIGANSREEIIFVRNATEGINLVAQAWGRTFLKPGDEVLVTEMEHHANIVPWQLVCQQTGAVLKAAPIDDRGQVDLDRWQSLLNERSRLVGICHMSNALGTVNPVKQMAELAHANGSLVLVDGAQSAYHMPINVQDLGADFFVFSGHKLYGPTGIGVLYGRQRLLEEMPPWMGGGDMIEHVAFGGTSFNKLPWKFEAGTPHIAGVIGLGEAVDYLTGIGMNRIAEHETSLMAYGTERLASVPGLRMIGTAEHKASVISFTLGHIHPHDVGTVLDQEGIAVRTGQHCAHPVMQRFGVPATVRASLALYNTTNEIDRLAEGLIYAGKVIGL